MRTKDVSYQGAAQDERALRTGATHSEMQRSAADFGSATMPEASSAAAAIIAALTPPHPV